MDETLLTQFKLQVESNPHAIAVECNDATWTYHQLDQYSGYISNSIKNSGIKTGSIVAVTGNKSFAMIAAIIGIVRAGCAYMPIEASLPTSIINAMLMNSGCELIIGHHIQIHVDIKTMELDNIVIIGTDVNDALNMNGESPAYIMHTSGSTGLPKAVVVPHRALLRLLVKANYIDLNNTDRVLFHSNTSFDAGIFEVWAALLNGGTLVISPFMTGDITAVHRLCNEKKITILLLATGLFHIFVNLQLSELTYLRYIVVGGDVMHLNAVKRAFSALQNVRIINGYGPAENSVFTSCYVMTSDMEIRNPIPIGTAISKTDIYILDENLHHVSEGESGELYTSGAGIALGYLNQPELTSKKFIKIPSVAGAATLYKTGDIVRRLQDGNIEFIGRQDTQLKIRGFRVDVSETETAISSLSGVSDVCVCVREGEVKKLIAYVVLETDSLLTDSSIRHQLSEMLPEYAVPSYFIISSYLPVTLNGKLDRKMLQRQANQLTT